MLGGPATVAGSDDGQDDDESFDSDAQAGVQDIEATTSVWTKTARRRLRP